MLHSTAIAHPAAAIGQGAEVGPFCVGRVRQGRARAKLLVHVVVGRHATTEETVIYPFYSIGLASQDRK